MVTLALILALGIPISSFAELSPLPEEAQKANEGGPGSAAFISAGGKYESFWNHHGYTPGDEYAHRLQVTPDTKYAPIGTEDRPGGMECVETRNDAGYFGLTPSSYSSIYMFNAKTATPGTIGMSIKNLKYYNAVTNKTDIIDMEFVITGWDVDTSKTYSYIFPHKSPMVSMNMAGIYEITVKESYYWHDDANTKRPYDIYGNKTITDIDGGQYFGLKALDGGTVKNIYLDNHSVLSYRRVSGYYTFKETAGNLAWPTEATYNRYAAGYSYHAPAIEYVFGQRATGGSIFGIGQNAMDMPTASPDDVMFGKWVTDSDETNMKSNTLQNSAEVYTYNLTALIPAGMDETQYFSKFEFSDELDSCLSVESVSVKRNGADVAAGRYNKTVNGNSVKIAFTAAALSDEWFYGGKSLYDTEYTVAIKRDYFTGFAHALFKAYEENKEAYSKNELMVLDLHPDLKNNRDSMKKVSKRKRYTDKKALIDGHADGKSYASGIAVEGEEFTPDPEKPGKEEGAWHYENCAEM